MDFAVRSVPITHFLHTQSMIAELIIRSEICRRFAAYPISVVCFALCLVAPELSRAGPLSSKPSVYQYDPTVSKKTVHVRMSGREYDFPENLFRPDSIPEHEPRAIWMVSLLPGLEGRTNQNRAEIMTKPGWGRRVMILINIMRVSEETFMQRRFQYMDKAHGPFEIRSTNLGLVHRYPKPPSKARNESRQEVYVFPSKDNARVIISCLKISDVPIPSCSQFFALNGSTSRFPTHENF